jgi:hypothetical protein
MTAGIESFVKDVNVAVFLLGSVTLPVVDHGEQVLHLRYLLSLGPLS